MGGDSPATPPTGNEEAHSVPERSSCLGNPFHTGFHKCRKPVTTASNLAGLKEGGKHGVRDSDPSPWPWRVTADLDTARPSASSRSTGSASGAHLGYLNKEKERLMVTL